MATLPSSSQLSFAQVMTAVNDNDTREFAVRDLKWARAIRGDTTVDPQGWQRVSVKRFSDVFFRIHPKAMTLEMVPRDWGMENRTLFYYPDGTGLAIAQVENGLNLYRFGCRHMMERVQTVGKNVATFRCKKCGYVKDVDTTD